METYDKIQVFGYKQGQSREQCVPMSVFEAVTNGEGHLIVHVVISDEPIKPKSIEVTVNETGKVLQTKVVDIKDKG